MNSDDYVFKIGSTALIIMAVVIGSLVAFAEAQLDIESKLEQLLEEGKEKCEIWQTHQYLYQPIRLEMEYEGVTDSIFRVSFEDSATKPDWDGDEDDFVFESRNFTDTFTIEVLLDYSNSTLVPPYDIFYRIFTDDGRLTHEGNWVHEGIQFCKVFSLNTDVRPEFPTPEETAEALEKKTEKILKTIKDKVSLLENASLWEMAIVMSSALAVLVMVAINWENIRGIHKKVKEPIEKYNTLEKRFKKLVKNMVIILRVVNESSKETKDTITKAIIDLRASYVDFAVTGQGIREKQKSEESKIEVELEKIFEEEVTDDEMDDGIRKEVKEKSGGLLKKLSNITKRDKEEEPKTEQDWVKIFLGQSRSDNEKEERKISDDYDKNPTKEKADKLTAIRRVLMEQV